MNRIVLPCVAALLAAGCTDKPVAEPPVSATAAAEASAAAAPAASAAKASAEPGEAASDSRVSRYTSLANCSVIDDGGGEDWSVSRCKGLGPWTLQVDYGDARDELLLLRQGQAETRLNLIELGGGGFNALGNTVEWRGKGEGAAFAPTALILRNNLSEDPERSERQTGILYVVDLAKGCVIAQVRPEAQQNEQARAIADGLARSCLK